MNLIDRDEQTPEPVPVAAPPLHRRLPGGRTLRDGRRLYWWGELLAAGIFYGVYTFIRNLHHGGRQEAYQNALDLMDLGAPFEIVVADDVTGQCVHAHCLRCTLDVCAVCGGPPL